MHNGILHNDIQHNAERCYAECHIVTYKPFMLCDYAECRYAECRFAECGGALSGASYSAKDLKNTTYSFFFKFANLWATVTTLRVPVLMSFCNQFYFCEKIRLAYFKRSISA